MSSCLEPQPLLRPESSYPVSSAQSYGASIQRDDAGVAHIEADTLEELLYAWGYVHGTDRLWQMDYLYRLGLGRASSVYGLDSAKSDAFVQLLGLESKADALAADMRTEAPRDYRLARAYAAGVNRARAEQLSDLPHQFDAYGIEPLPWSPEASMVMVLLQSLDMTLRTVSTDLEAALIEERLGGERYRELFGSSPELASHQTSIIASEDLARSEASEHSTGVQPAPTEEGGAELSASDGGGSNAWAIGGSRSVSGAAIFANDAHLKLKAPSFWHECHVRLSSGEFDLYGFAVAGVPMFSAGFSADLAWGITLGYGNAMDIVSYPLESDGESYENERGEIVRFSEVEPQVEVKVGPFYVPLFWLTREVSEDGIRVNLDLEGHSDRALVLQWSAMGIKRIPVGRLLDALKAKTAGTAQELMSAWEAPNFNMVWADREGGLAFRQLGLIPSRKKGTLGLVDASSSDEAWGDYLSSKEMPHVVNPARDYIVSANNTPTIDHMFGGHYLGHGFRPGYRARRIEEMIEAKPRHSFEDIVAMQLDVLVPEARIVLERMLERVGSFEPSSLEAGAVERLAAWNQRAGVESPEATIFLVWKQRLMDALFGAELEKIGKIPFRKTPLRLPVDSLWRVFEGTLEHPGDLDVIVRSSLRATVAQLTADLGEPGAGFESWQWGEYHPMTIRALDGNPMWDLAPFPSAGTRNTVSMAKEEGTGPYDAGAAASFRLVVELGESVRAAGVLPGKSRDTPTLDYPRDVQRWRQGELRPFRYYPKDIAAHIESSRKLSW